LVIALSLEDMLEKGREQYSSNIAALDSEVPKGFPRNAFGVIRGPGGGGKSALLNEMAIRMMESGKKVIFVCLEDTPVAILQNLTSLGWDHKNLLNEDAIHLIDCFSSHILRRMTKYELTTVVRNPSDPDEISDALHTVVREEEGNDVGGIYMDSITELFFQSHPFKAVNALKAWRATFCKDMVIPCWATYHTGLQQFATYDDMLTYSSDIIIDTRHEPVFQEAGLLLKQFRVTKVKGAPHNPMWVTFEVGSEGLKSLSLDEIRELAKGITRFDAGSSS
jgi:KaiC/GvpD/RAD55 family RecA-like ATPase